MADHVAASRQDAPTWACMTYYGVRDHGCVIASPLENGGGRLRRHRSADVLSEPIYFKTDAAEQATDLLIHKIRTCSFAADAAGDAASTIFHPPYSPIQLGSRSFIDQGVGGIDPAGGG
eukprot:TRINITY_DN7348_c0_g1_i1.p2 TRINITY_DN7348_c0_g1~~TRINITY_DN7348_c0_g1_i1.p2  ORF type:complete len:127 (+),score=13.07 TRINITY_DN7348_c0_g1_i1:25-381(+)